MPTPIDAMVLAILLISGLLAMVRGLMREILSIAAWITAALAAVLAANSKMVPWAQDFLKNDIAAKLAVALGVFTITLIVVSMITTRLSDMVLDSKIGALDRTLGFLFGIARGLLIASICLIFYEFFAKPDQRSEWVTQAKSLVVLEKLGIGLTEALPQELAETIFKKLSKKAANTDDDPDSGSPAAGNEGYSKPARDSLKKLIEKPAAK
jgi:membrane protein required for colicin V production